MIARIALAALPILSTTLAAPIPSTNILTALADINLFLGHYAPALLHADGLVKIGGRSLTHPIVILNGVADSHTTAGSNDHKATVDANLLTHTTIHKRSTLDADVNVLVQAMVNIYTRNGLRYDMAALVRAAVEAFAKIQFTTSSVIASNGKITLGKRNVAADAAALVGATVQGSHGKIVSDTLAITDLDIKKGRLTSSSLLLSNNNIQAHKRKLTADTAAFVGAVVKTGHEQVASNNFAASALDVQHGKISSDTVAISNNQIDAHKRNIVVAADAIVGATLKNGLGVANALVKGNAVAVIN